MKYIKKTYLLAGLIFLLSVTGCNSFLPQKPNVDASPAPIATNDPSKQDQASKHGPVDNLALEKQNEVKKDYLIIKDHMFITQINDIYTNIDSYANKTIEVQGMFTYFDSYDGSSKVPVVYRRGPGCCNNDGWGGFFLDYDGDFPKDNDWIKVIGKPYLVKKKYFSMLYLKVESIEVMKERGLEFVAQ